MKFLLLNLFLTSQVFAHFSGTQVTQNLFCDSRFEAYAWAEGYGSQNTNCNVARRTAERSAFFQCYASGQEECEARGTYNNSVNYNRCEARSFVDAAPWSRCEPRNTFVRTAWARNYGSESRNCQRAESLANEAATVDCLRAGYRFCENKMSHRIRVESNAYCEVGFIVKGFN